MTIHYYGDIADLTGKEWENWEIANTTVREFLDDLAASYGPKLAGKIFATETGQIQDVFLLLNGRHLRYYQGLTTMLKDGDEICIIPLIDGG